MLSAQGQGAITERLRSFSMHDLSQIDHSDPPNQLYPGYSNPGRRARNPNVADDEYYPDEQEDKTDEEMEGTFSEDEAVTQRGLRRSQTVKLTRSKVRREVRYGSLRIKGRRRPALTSVNYAL
ncbi:hypothetical protein JZ751_007844 [Albula glossodonta]|uniref:Uncharacterized protein n=1 Tax=Albula glossodonta TaxID=121402 RepID=A0A8T2P122_9TELE|nr:hypothetical protein JZ751_007844 [Albula glossodonta]